MLKAIRLLTVHDLSYAKPTILEPGDGFDIPNFFEDAQFVVKVDSSTLVMPSYNVSYIHLRKNPKILPKELGRKITRLSVGDKTFEGVHVLYPGKSPDINVPWIFNKLEQFVFCDKHLGLFVTTDSNIAAMEW